MSHFIRSRTFAHALLGYLAIGVVVLIAGQIADSDRINRIALLMFIPGLAVALIVMYLDGMDGVNQRHEKRMQEINAEYERNMEKINEDHERTITRIRYPNERN